MTREDGQERTTEQNAEALRETRRELDADAARIADNARGVEALESPALPDRSHGNPEADDAGGGTV